MEKITVNTVLLLVATLTVSACGGSETSDGSVSVNTPPTVTINPVSPVEEGQMVTLTGATQDAEGSVVTVAWVQISGPSAHLESSNNSQLTFKAPQVTGTADLSFQLTATDDKGGKGTASVVLRVNDETVVTAERALAKAVEERVRPRLDTSDSIKGLDTNGDGIRDDIALYIEQQAVTDKQKVQMKSYANVLQQMLQYDPVTITDPESFARDVAQSVVCLLGSFDDIQEASKYRRQIDAYTANTKDRAYALHAYSQSRDGTVMRLPNQNNCATTS